MDRREGKVTSVSELLYQYNVTMVTVCQAYNYSRTSLASGNTTVINNTEIEKQLEEAPKRSATCGDVTNSTRELTEFQMGPETDSLNLVLGTAKSVVQAECTGHVCDGSGLNSATKMMDTGRSAQSRLHRKRWYVM